MAYKTPTFGGGEAKRCLVNCTVGGGGGERCARNSLSWAILATNNGETGENFEHVFKLRFISIVS